MTDEELQELSERLQREAIRKMEERAGVAPEGATNEAQGQNYTIPRAAAQGVGNVVTAGAYPALNAMTDVGTAALHPLRGADLLTNALGMEDAIDIPPIPNLMDAYSARRGEREQLQEEAPFSFGAGEVAGSFVSPLNRALSAGVGMIEKPINRVLATGGATAGEDALYNANMGMEREDILNNALTAGAFGSGMQTVGEGINKFVRGYGQSPAAGEARAKDQIYETNVLSGAENADDLARRSQEMGPGAVAADLSPGLLEIAANEQLPLYSLRQFNDFMRGRTQLGRENLRGRLEKDFPSIDVLTPGDIDGGVAAYRKALQPRYSAVIKTMNDSGYTVPGNELHQTLRDAITLLPDGTRDLGASMDAYRDVLKTLERYAVDKLGGPTAKRIKRGAISAAREDGEAQGLSGADLRDYVAEVRDNFSLLDYVDFTPRDIHRMKQTIDGSIPGVPFDAANKEIKRAALLTTRRQLADSLNKVSDEVFSDPAADSYRKLNAEFSGTATAKEAYKYGTELLKDKAAVSDIAAKISDFEAGDLPFLMEGFKHTMVESVLDADTVTNAAKLLRDPKFHGKLSTLIGEEAAASLIKDVDSHITQISTGDRAMKILSDRQKNEIKNGISKAWRNIVDLGLIGGVAVNALGSGSVKGPGMYSGAFMGSARRLANNLAGADVAKGKSIADIAMMPGGSYADLVQGLPQSARMNTPGYVPGAAALSVATDPIITGEDVVQGAQGANQTLMDLLQQLQQ